MDKESERNGISRGIPKDMIKLKGLIEENNEMDHGYLICKSCSGYYKLKDNEFPEDFKGCQCGSSMEYHKDIDVLNSFQNSNYSNNSNYIQNDLENNYNDEYLEMQEIIDLIKHDAEDRKKYLEKLQKKIRKQETLLNTIKNDNIRGRRDIDWSLWKYLEDNGIESDIKGQKMVLDDFIEQENFLLSKVKERRSGGIFRFKGIFNSFYGRLAILTWILVFLGIVGIYAMK